MRKIHEIFQMRPIKGDIGFEIEIEGGRFPQVSGWRTEVDHSLRGEAVEYVLKSPCSAEMFSTLLERMDEQFSINDTQYNDSFRAGAHCHINVQQLNFVQLTSFLTAYYILEEIIVDWCGPNRVNNHFCLRAIDADTLVQGLSSAFREKFGSFNFNDEYRYAAMNLAALPLYGSVEFRAMRSTRDFSQYMILVETLLNIKDISLKYETPEEIISLFSSHDEQFFAQEFLGKHASLFIDPDNMQRKLHRGMRVAQDLAYSADWPNLIKESSNKGLFGEGQHFYD